MILSATRQLLQYDSEQHIGDWTNSAYGEFISRFGSAEDAEALLDGFLANPRQRGALLAPLMALGNRATDEALFQNCFTGGELMPGLSEDILHCLGYLGYTEALLEGIFQPGSTTASTDCNGGIILGVALYGAKGLPCFRQIMLSPHWQAGCNKTDRLTLE
jgi:hypothetical protein